jgi:Lon-like protease
VDTLEPILPPPGEPVPPTDGSEREVNRVRSLVLWWVVGVSLLLALIVAGGVIWAIQPTEFYALRPGSVTDTTDVIKVTGATRYDPVGQIGFTTISLESKVTNWEKRSYDDDPTITLLPSEVINGDRTDEERRQANLAQMERSKDVATVVALQFLGLAGEPSGSGALVRNVQPDSAADGVLVATDVIIEVAGEPIQFADELVAAVQQRSPGEALELAVQHFDGSTETVSVVLGESPDDADAAQLGVEVTTHELTADFPIDVDIDSGDVSGPSAGLAFTLGVIDVLTPGELTGGKLVATTGTINLDGSVGPVGGVAQKAVAARKAGVALFIVPSSEYEEALTQSGDMQVEVADTLEEAIAVLEAFGGKGIALDQVALGD